MADEQKVYEDIAEFMRRFGYGHVTAELVRQIDEGSASERPEGVVSMFAAKQLKDARDSGRLPPKP